MAKDNRRVLGRTYIPGNRIAGNILLENEGNTCVEELFILNTARGRTATL